MVIRLTKSYSEMQRFQTFDERFEYLKLANGIGQATFGFDRYLNQNFYNSREWQDVRRIVMIRDNGCDLGVIGYDFNFSPLIHHMNPMSVEDIVHGQDWILDPEYLILTTHKTHNDIHFGSKRTIPRTVIARTPGDTNLW